MTYNNGDVATGDFQGIKPHGQKITYKKRFDWYYGDMQNGQANGKGEIYVPQDDGTDKLVYEGEFKDNLKHGRGRETDRYEFVGDFEEGRKKQGKIIFNNGLDKFEGTWYGFEGRCAGTIIYNNAGLYRGQCRDTGSAIIPDGEGSLVTENVTTYKGTWVYGEKQGKFLVTPPNTQLVQPPPAPYEQEFNGDVLVVNQVN
jgi:hypothetical protein